MGPSQNNCGPQVYHHKLDGAALSAILLPSNETDSSKIIKKRRSEEMRQKHNLISQRGRQRINDEISKLKQILPECRDVECNKAAVLQCAVKNIDNFTRYTSSLCINSQNLEKELQRVWMTCQHLAEDISQLKNKPMDHIIAEYEIDPPIISAVPLPCEIQYENVDDVDMHLAPPFKRQRRQDDDDMIESTNWSLDSY